MTFFVYLILLLILTILSNNYLIKKNMLSSFTGDNHQKFASKQKIPLTGGIFLFVNFAILFSNQYLSLLLFCLLILILGILSDLKYIFSAFIRFFFQIIIILSFIIFNDIQIFDTRIFFIDKILENEIYNYLFVTFCILIVVNGSNFIDGLNTLNIGYYLLIILIIFKLTYENEIIVNDIYFEHVISILFCVFVLNLFNQLYLGDSGSYLLGFIFSILLITIYNWNNHISPFFIILLLWYPCYETLFSIIRKNILKKSPMSPDANHLHQLVFYLIKKRFKMDIYLTNLLSANIINIYNLIIFIICSNFISNSQIQIFFILLYLIIYTFIYFKIFIFRYFKK